MIVPPTGYPPSGPRGSRGAQGESEAALSILIDFGRDTEFSFERRLRG
ncbi:hypothetical protein GTY80_47315, partial [Amycolatopsis sp. SID8362]|nr:hypothetical protein [Amycolatopsis sp. SID8362]